MLEVVIFLVILPCPPIDDELDLMDSIPDPMEPHVHGPGFTSSQPLVGESRSSGVICLNWSRGSCVSQLLQCCAENNGFLALEK